MIYKLVSRNFECSLEFVFSLLLLQPFNVSPVCFACNFQEWGCVILREIDFLLKIGWSIPCLHPSWKVHTWTIVAIWRKVRFHQALPFMTKQSVSSVVATSRQHQKFGIIDIGVATSDILTWHQMWCSQINFWCLMLWQQIWCWLDSCFFPHFLSFQDENKLDSWFLSLFNQSLTLICGVTRGLTLGDKA